MIENLVGVEKIENLDVTKNGGIFFTLRNSPEPYLIMDQDMKDRLLNYCNMHSVSFQTTDDAYKLLCEIKAIDKYCAVYLKQIGGVSMTTVMLSEVPAYAFFAYYSPCTTNDERSIIVEECNSAPIGSDEFRAREGRVLVIANGVKQDALYNNLSEAFCAFTDRDKVVSLVFNQGPPFSSSRFYHSVCSNNVGRWGNKCL